LASAERAAEARKEADKLACEAWNQRMLGYKGPAQPSPTLGDALNAGFLYLEVRCLGCDTHQTVSLDIVRRPKTTPIHELECYMCCKDCSQVRGYPYSAAIWSRCGQRRFQRAIRPRRGGRGSDDLKRCARSGFLYRLAIHRRWRAVDNNLLLCLPSASSLLCLKSMCTMHDQHER
jgi:hypothetical protein